MALSRRRPFAVAAAVLLLATGVAAGCGDDSNPSADANGAADLPTTLAPGGGGATPTSADSPEAKAIAERGEPTIAKVYGPVSDLKITDDVVGTGQEAKPGDTVTVQYKGAVASTGEVFDSSWTDGEPVTFPLDRVIQGWSDGIPGMKAGGRRTLVIPAAMAYGSTAPPGSGIPANADLVFVVDLVSVSG